MAYTVRAAVHSELLIRKSRFVGCVEPVSDRDAALEVVASLRGKHPGAAHVCWALMAGGQSAAVDDGEPSGTAGRPMLEVLRHHDLDGVLATAVRYFGGVKLGAGGLLRAYTDCVAQAMQHADKLLLQQRLKFRCLVPYDFEGRLRRELEAASALIEQITHGDAVECIFGVEEPVASQLITDLNEAASGRIRWFDRTG